MAENPVLEKHFCRFCGADIRSQALFCYSCGKSVSGEKVAETGKIGKEDVSNAWFREELTSGAKTNNLDSEILPKNEPEEVPVVKKTAKLKKQNAKIKTPTPETGATEKLKTAASIRQNSRAKTFRKQKVEVVWEQSESESNLKFIAVAIFLALIAGGSLLVMLWIR